MWDNEARCKPNWLPKRSRIAASSALGAIKRSGVGSLRPVVFESTLAESESLLGNINSMPWKLKPRGGTPGRRLNPAGPRVLSDSF